MSDRRDRLDRAVSRRDKAREDVQRIKGRLEAAEKELEVVETECRDKGVDPDALDAAIAKLDERYEATLQDLEDRITETEAALKPFVGED
jgi:chromosome segregation ATPase